MIIVAVNNERITHNIRYFKGTFFCRTRCHSERRKTKVLKNQKKVMTMPSTCITFYFSADLQMCLNIAQGQGLAPPPSVLVTAYFIGQIKGRGTHGSIKYGPIRVNVLTENYESQIIKLFKFIPLKEVGQWTHFRCNGLYFTHF